MASFQPYVDKLNALLDNIYVERQDPSFRLLSRATGDEIEPGKISSGEAELISLGIEILTFATEVQEGKSNYLFLDEPDVHLHPDLQARLVVFLREAVDAGNFTVILATHSTAILGGLADYGDTAVAFMRAGDQELKFAQVTESYRRILPVFGAHPLSNVFNETPVLLVEGEDDVRIWQQAVRSSTGGIRLYPVACDTVTEINTYEAAVRDVISAVYESARAFSLRDRDGREGELDDEPPITRMRLSCRAAENLVLSDDVLDDCGLDWPEAKRRITSWLEGNASHPRHAEMQAFLDGGCDRKDADLKELRMVLVGMVLNSAKPWEVLVGKSIAKLRQRETGGPSTSGHSLRDYLGEKVVETLLPPS